MQVKSQEFVGKYVGLEVISNNDSGLFAVQYSEPEKVKAPTVKSIYSDWGNPQAHTVELSITAPTPRRVLRSLIIVKSSANCYRVAYADANNAVQFVAKTYAEIEDMIDEYWKRK